MSACHSASLAALTYFLQLFDGAEKQGFMKEHEGDQVLGDFLFLSVDGNLVHGSIFVHGSNVLLIEKTSSDKYTQSLHLNVSIINTSSK